MPALGPRTSLGVTFFSSKAASQRAPVPRMVILQWNADVKCSYLRITTTKTVALTYKSNGEDTHPSLSTQSHNTLGDGTNGEPSYRTTVAPTASADTSQFHIIQPV